MTPRRILRIARWELSRSLGSVDRRTLAGFLVVGLLLGTLGPALSVAQPTPGDELYRVGVSESSPYAPVVASDRRLETVHTDSLSGEVDILVEGTDLVVPDREISQAAASVFREAVVAYNDRLLREDPDEAAAFPVTVSLRYVEQTPRRGADRSVDTETGGSAESPPSTTVEETADQSAGSTETEPETTTPTSTDTQPVADEPSTATSDATADGQTTVAGESVATDGVDGETTSGTGPVADLLGAGQSGTPGDIRPPFPLESLLLAFVFLLPFNFVIQAYGSSVFAERIDRRGEPLLVTPASRGDIVLGKALPYFAGMITLTGLIAFVLDGSVRSVLAIAPLAALFLAATFVAGILARSYKELTFTTVTISLGLTAYAFLPAVFAEVHPIAAISPLTIVVNDLQGTAIAWETFLLGTAPAGLSAAVLFAFGTGLYREEDLFTRKPLPAKFLDALSAPLSSRWRVGLWTALFVPFVLVAELLAVAALFVVPVELSIPLVLFVIAIVEELAKSLHVYAGFRRGRFSGGRFGTVLVGLSSGVGFFVAEKLLAITQLVGLPNLDVGRAAFAPEVLGLGAGVLLLAPLGLHAVTATVSALGASHSRRRYLLGLALAVSIHLAYNLAVVSVLG